MTKNIYQLIPDVYKLLEEPQNHITEEAYKRLGEDLVANVKRSMEEERKKDTLRISNFGKPLRQLYFDLKEESLEPKFKGRQLLSFLFGSITESLLLWLAEQAGHSVEERQKEVVVEGIVGHKDVVLDSVPIDVKSASSYGFKKFTTGMIKTSDPYGYMQQVAAYASDTPEATKAGFLAMDKSSGELCLRLFDVKNELPDPVARAKLVKEALASDTPPEEKCYEDIPEGTSGNRILSPDCGWCRHKHKCWENLRTFDYAKGPVHFTVVKKEPKVEEITNNNGGETQESVLPGEQRGAGLFRPVPPVVHPQTEADK